MLLKAVRLEGWEKICTEKRRELRNINRCESVFANSRQDSKGEGLYQTWTALDDQFTLTRTTLFN